MQFELDGRQRDTHIKQPKRQTQPEALPQTETDTDTDIGRYMYKFESWAPVL